MQPVALFAREGGARSQVGQALAVFGKS
jgi:hypothetical protein